jgi:outer membrane receptor protein involved in Fe transport
MVGAGAVDLVSSSSWGYRNLFNAAPAAADTAFDGSISAYDSFTEEFRASSTKGWSDRWDYMFGLYFQRETQTFNIFYGQPGVFQNIVSRTREKAVFGEAGYKFTDRFSARLGLRKQTVDFQDVSNSRLAEQQLNESSGKNTPTTGRILGSYDISADALTYASISRGFRKGGLNPIFDANGKPISGIPLTFSPDTTTNYEIGWKLTFPAMKATLNAALYHINWHNIQIAGLATVPGFAMPQQYYQNASGAKIDGFELEGGAELFTGLRGQLSFSLMNPVLTANQPGTSCLRGCPGRVGDEIPYVSRVTGSATLDYHHALGSSNMKGFVILTGQYTGPRNTDFRRRDANTGELNRLFAEMRPNVLANLQLGIDVKQLRVALYIDNLFDRRNQLSVSPPTNPDPSSGGDEVSVDRPFTVGLWVRYSIF